MKKIISCIVMTGLLVGLLIGCTYRENDKKDSGNKTITIAYQYGLAYAPVLIMKEKQIIEKKYKEQTGNTINVNWTQINSGADVNTGFAAGNIDVGFLGVAPAVTGCLNQVGYKIFTGVSGQEHGMMTNQEDITSLADLVGSDNQIALVNIGSIQHIILALALENQGYDPHALDTNIVAMKHPDGMNALKTGNVPVQLTTNPYLYQEKKDSSLHEIEGITEVWANDNSFVVGVLSTKIYEENEELYRVIADAVEESISLINNDVENAAGITCELDGNTLDEEMEYMKMGMYKTQTNGIFELAKFMKKAGFIEKEPAEFEELVYKNVEGD